MLTVPSHQFFSTEEREYREEEEHHSASHLAGRQGQCAVRLLGRELLVYRGLRDTVLVIGRRVLNEVRATEGINLRSSLLLGLGELAEKRKLASQTEGRLCAARASQIRCAGKDLLEIREGGADVQIGERQLSNEILEVVEGFRHAELVRFVIFQAHDGPGSRIHLLDDLGHSFGYPATKIASASSCNVGHDGSKGIIAAESSGTETSQPVVDCVWD